jgi:hypothetical protein
VLLPPAVTTWPLSPTDLPERLLELRDELWMRREPRAGDELVTH